MYFKEFPSFLYDFKYEGDVIRTEVVKDVTRNIRVKKEILSNITVYDEYDLVDGDTPEIIAEKFYGNPEYHWIVMLTNEKFDWLNDYPLTETQITKHIEHTYNPTIHSYEGSWELKEIAESNGYRLSEQRLYFVLDDNTLPLDPEYLTQQITYTVSGQTENCKFEYTFDWPDIRYGDAHNGLIRETQQLWQVLPYEIGTLTTLPSSKHVKGTNTQFTTNCLVGMDIYTASGTKLGRIASIENDTELTFVSNATAAITNGGWYMRITGKPVGQLTITTTGRQYNPVFFINQNGFIVNPSEDGAIPVNGDTLHRTENDRKRRIKLVSPALIETVIKNFEELL